MQAPPSFSDLIAAADRLAAGLDEDGLVSLAMPLAPVDPLRVLPELQDAEGFRFLWDGSPGLCLAASGRAHHLELSGPRRFELAQRFSALTLSRLASGPLPCPALARPRLLLAFAFFASPLLPGGGAPGVQAVLPRWQLSRQGHRCWLRLQGGLGGGVTPRGLAEELWEMARHLETCSAQGFPPCRTPRLRAAPLAIEPSWQVGYRQTLEQALELVRGGDLRKLVLAARQQLRLESAPDPLTLLAQLRQSQSGSCRFLWQRGPSEALLGASPERLLTVRQGQLRSDGLAGTAPQGAGAPALLRSVKDRHEHELVVETITEVLQAAGLNPRRSRHPRLVRHGALVHLHTPITARLEGQHPLALAAALHPTPAVAGLPRRQAMRWRRTQEPFERGHYAAPIGWLDSEGDADLRVAIRSGMLRGDQLELTAGAGLVCGSQPERELQEVALKLGVLQQQLHLLDDPNLDLAPF